VTTDRRIRVMIVEDSGVVRELLAHIVNGDPRLALAAAVPSAEEALRVLPAVAPDVISLDMRLPGMNGLEATRRIMSEHPTPIVVVAASVEDEELKISMNALRAGALAVVEKPVGTTQASYAALAEHIRTQLVIMSQVAVVRQRPRPAREVERGPLKVPALPEGGFRLVAVVSSTGGPAALATFLTGLGPDFPLPVLVIQHIVPSFHSGFVAWLQDQSPLPVRDAVPGQAPAPGIVHVARPEAHLVLRAGRLEAQEGPPVAHLRPSGDVLLRSVARELGPRAIAAVLTGMGEDGARGLLEVRRAGGYTLAEDESTAVVYGMPGAAVSLGAAAECLPLPLVAPRVRVLAGGGGRA
jgi:two-component system, chemotaxis family, protein-glutamate methylesterase/glutaminase